MEKVRIPAWKRWISWIVPLDMETSASHYNEWMSVRLVRGRLQLLTRNAIYSYDDLYDNFDKAFSVIRLEQIREALVLGLGLGSIPYLLEKKYGLSCNITAVEIDEEVIYLAGKYSLHRLRNHIDTVCANAEIFVASTDEKFDLICMDIFVDERIPPQFLEEDFLRAIEQILSGEGIFLFNHLATTPADRQRAQEYFDKVFSKVFPKAYIIRTKHNYILLQDKMSLKE